VADLSEVGATRTKDQFSMGNLAYYKRWIKISTADLALELTDQIRLGSSTLESMVKFSLLEVVLE